MASRVLTVWNPEDKAFWEKEGKARPEMPDSDTPAPTTWIFVRRTEAYSNLSMRNTRKR